MNDLSDHPRYREARHYVEQLKGFYTHASVYVLVNLGLFALGSFTGRPHSWYPWPALAWGIGLVAHGAWVYALGGLLGPSWEERKIREYLERRGGWSG